MYNRIVKYLARKEINNIILSKNDIIEKLHRKIVELESKKVETLVLKTRLDRSEFNRIKDKAYPMVVNNTSTDLQVAALVGQQLVFDLIERELVNG